MSGICRRVAVAVLLVSLSGACASQVPGTPSPTDAPPTGRADQTPDAPRPSPSPSPPSPPPLASQTPSGTPSPSPDPPESVAVDPDALPVYVSGPFGTLDGLATTGGWPAARDLRRLDQFVESAPLVMGFRDSDIEFGRWTVSIAPAEDPGDGTADVMVEGPSAGERADLAVIDGPRAGDWVLRADVEPATGDPAAHHWRLAVPDRPLPADGIVEPPLPDLLVSAGDETATAALGSSCYVSTCADAPRPPLRLLPILQRAPGDQLTLALSDGSGFVSWVVGAWPSDGLDDAPREIDRGDAEDGVETAVIAVPRGADRVVSVTLRFDVERGDATYYLRLTEP